MWKEMEGKLNFFFSFLFSSLLFFSFPFFSFLTSKVSLRQVFRSCMAASTVLQAFKNFSQNQPISASKRPDSHAKNQQPIHQAKCITSFSLSHAELVFHAKNVLVSKKIPLFRLVKQISKTYKMEFSIISVKKICI